METAEPDAWVLGGGTAEVGGPGVFPPLHHQADSYLEAVRRALGLPLPPTQSQARPRGITSPGT